jgi:hypothetical protein
MIFLTSNFFKQFIKFNKLIFFKKPRERYIDTAPHFYAHNMTCITFDKMNCTTQEEWKTMEILQ